MLTNQDEIRERIIQIRKERVITEPASRLLGFPERITVM